MRDSTSLGIFKRFENKIALLFARIANLQKPNFTNNENSGTIGPGEPVTFDSLPITRHKSGNVYVDMEIGGTLAAQDAVTVNLQRDGSGPVIGTKSFAPGGVAPFDWSVTITEIDLLPDGLPHFYRLTVTTAAATAITIPPGNADAQLIEL